MFRESVLRISFFPFSPPPTSPSSSNPPPPCHKAFAGFRALSKAEITSGLLTRFFLLHFSNYEDDEDVEYAENVFILSLSPCRLFEDVWRGGCTALITRAACDD